jgi:hypothetical protein
MRTIGKDQILISASWENEFSQEISPRTNLPTNNTELLPARTGKETVKVFFYLKTMPTQNVVSVYCRYLHA